jgi:hypothetical protein
MVGKFWKVSANQFHRLSCFFEFNAQNDGELNPKCVVVLKVVLEQGK